MVIRPTKLGPGAWSWNLDSDLKYGWSPLLSHGPSSHEIKIWSTAGFYILINVMNQRPYGTLQRIQFIVSFTVTVLLVSGTAGGLLNQNPTAFSASLLYSILTQESIITSSP